MCGALALLTTGCSSLYKPDPILITAYKDTFPWEGTRFLSLGEKGVYLNPYTYNPGDTATGTVSLWKIATDNNKAAKDRVAARNLLQNAVLRISDQVTAHHLAKLKGYENNTNLILGSAALGLTGGAAVAGEAAAKALAVAATGVVGARELFNDQVFRNALIETIIAAIEADRSKYLEDVIHAGQKKPIEEYDVEAALKDANEYHFRGSFYHGLGLVRDAAEKENNRKREALEARRQNAQLPPDLQRWIVLRDTIQSFITDGDKILKDAGGTGTPYKDCADAWVKQKITEGKIKDASLDDFLKIQHEESIMTDLLTTLKDKQKELSNKK